MLELLHALEVDAQDAHAFPGIGPNTGRASSGSDNGLVPETEAIDMFGSAGRLMSFGSSWAPSSLGFGGH